LQVLMSATAFPRQTAFLNTTNLFNVTSTTCDTSCGKIAPAITCTAGCKGVDKAICYGTDWILCKVSLQSASGKREVVLQGVS
jgi:hypothetical protein